MYYFKYFLVSCFALILPLSVFALGITPPAFDAGIMQPDDVKEFSIKLLRGVDEQGDLEVKIQPSGDGTGHFIGEESIVLENEYSNIEYAFNIAPTAGAIGKYNINIDFLVKKISDNPNELNLVSGASATVSYAVENDGEYNFEITDISYDIDEQEVNINMEYKNTGSLDLQLSKVIFDVIEKNSGKKIQISINQDNIPLIIAQQTSVVSTTLDNIIPGGLYEISVQAESDQTENTQSKTINNVMLLTADKAQSSEVHSQNLNISVSNPEIEPTNNNNNQLFIIIVLLSVAFIILSAWLLLSLKKQK